MLRHGWIAMVTASAAAGLSLAATAAIPVPADLPNGCTQELIEKLGPLLLDLDATPGPAPDPVLDGSMKPPAKSCSSTSEVAAVATDDQVLVELHKSSDTLPVVQYGERLYVDTRPLQKTPKQLLSSLCTLAAHATSLHPSTGIVPNAGMGLNTANANDKWRGEIHAPPVETMPASRLSVAVIDGPVIWNHESLPPIDHFEVRGRVELDGTCLGGSCCTRLTSGPLSTPYEHSSWTIGTIAGVAKDESSPIGLSRPGRIIAIDPKTDSCDTLWALATAIQCALDEHADVIHYARGPEAGEAAHAQFLPVLERVAATDSVMVFPAGNHAVNLDDFPGWPNAFNSHALTVTAFGPDGGTGDETGFGLSTVDLGVPLGEIFTTCNDDAHCYHSHFGMTSGASAIVTGSILLMSGYANYRNCKPFELADRLRAHAHKPPNKLWWSAVDRQLDLEFLSHETPDALGLPKVGCLQ